MFFSSALILIILQSKGADNHKRGKGRFRTLNDTFGNAFTGVFPGTQMGFAQYAF